MPEVPVTNKHVVSRACDPEARLSDVPVDGTPSQTDPTAADHCVNPSDQVAPPSAPVVPSPAAFDLVALRERAESVMLGDGERPIASGIAAIASEATYGLIIAVRDVVSKLWAQRQDDIKSACSPQLIDEVDVHHPLQRGRHTLLSDVPAWLSRRCPRVCRALMGPPRGLGPSGPPSTPAIQFTS